MPLDLQGAAGLGAGRLALKALRGERLEEDAIAREIAQQEFANSFLQRQQAERERAAVTGEGFEGRRVNIAEGDFGLRQRGDERTQTIFDQGQEDRTGRRRFAETVGAEDAALGRALTAENLGFSGTNAARGTFLTPEQRGGESGRQILATFQQGGRDVAQGESDIAEGRSRRLYSLQPRSPVIVVGPDGRRVYADPRAAVGQEAPAPGANRPSTGTQREAMGYFNRMRSAIMNMERLEGQLGAKDIAAIQNVPEWTPDLIRNAALSDAGKQYLQALREYTTAKLRKESGAAIAASEWANEALTVAPSLGDPPEVLQQKADARARAAQGFAFASGPAYEDWFGVPFDPEDPLGRNLPGGSGGPGSDAAAGAPRHGEQRVDEQGRAVVWNDGRDGERGWYLAGGGGGE